MEEEKPKPSESNDVDEATSGNPPDAQTAAIGESATEVAENVTIDEAGTSGEVTNADADKPVAKRNYRRRTEGSDDSSSNEGEAEQPPNVDENQRQQESESEDVSLDELRVSASDDDNNASR